MCVQTITEQFYHKLLKLPFIGGKGLVNLVMSLSSYSSATSVVSLSESPVYHYQYSSICDSVHNFAADGTAYLDNSRAILRFLMSSYAGYEGNQPSSYLLAVDVCNAEKGFSPSLPNKTFNYKPNNQVPGNKPVSAGYPVSFVNLQTAEKSWSLPLTSSRVGISETEICCAQTQLNRLLNDKELPFGARLCKVVLDSKYGNAAYLSGMYEQANLVSIVRHRSGSKVYTSPESPKTATKGAPIQYETEYLMLLEDRIFSGKNKHGDYQKQQNSLASHLPHQDFYTQDTQTSAGRKLRIEVKRWNNLKIRTKKGQDMKDKSFDLCCAQVFDADTNKRIFDKELWFSINGTRKNEITTQDAYHSYRQRYNIEPFFRFNKQHLFFQDYQTPDPQHFDNWRIMAQLAVWSLFFSKNDCINAPKKWQKYLPVHQNAHQEPKQALTLAQTYHAAQTFFCTFDKKPFLPKTSNKPKGRPKGQTQTKRPKFPIVKKTKKHPKISDSS